MIIVQPLIIYVMMEKNYQLVAWTKDITDKENGRLYMIPSLESEVQASVAEDLARVHIEENKRHGRISTDLAIRTLRAYRNMSRFKIFTGHPGDGIRYLFFAAEYCIWEDSCNWDDCNWVYYDTDLGSYSHFCGKFRHEFEILCEEAIVLARKHGQEHIFLEGTPKRMLEIYREQNKEVRDLYRISCMSISHS